MVFSEYEKCTMSEAKLTSRERWQMRAKLRQTHDVRLYRRLPATLKGDLGVSIGAITEQMNVSRQSVCN